MLLSFLMRLLPLCRHLAAESSLQSIHSFSFLTMFLNFLVAVRLLP
jgi:hypothetical protein